MVEQQISVEDSLKEGARLVLLGGQNAINGLSEMVDQEIIMKTISARQIPVDDVPDLFGGREMVAVAVYLAVTGATEGHMFLVYPPQTAMSLVDLLLGEPSGTTTEITEMEASALGEMGNIMGSFYLNALSDASGLVLMPSPPAVIMDMAGSILDVALADILQESEDALVVEATFSTKDNAINGNFLVLPSPDFLRELSNRVASK
ncbi:MAG: chemotaxis protein CheC [SAR202 cluster bacterium]|nr:chemotaxis protein CheC [SAR202 cluster bacterium]